MLVRFSAVLLTTALLGGCSTGGNSLLAGLNPTNAAQAAEAADYDLSRKTLASKMLTAIALERITGRKPDPSRLAELD